MTVATGDDDETPITDDPAGERASAVALDHVGGGRVTEIEVEDDDEGDDD